MEIVHIHTISIFMCPPSLCIQMFPGCLSVWELSECNLFSPAISLFFLLLGKAWKKDFTGNFLFEKRQAMKIRRGRINRHLKFRHFFSLCAICVCFCIKSHTMYALRTTYEGNHCEWHQFIWHIPLITHMQLKLSWFYVFLSLSLPLSESS